MAHPGITGPSGVQIHFAMHWKPRIWCCLLADAGFVRNINLSSGIHQRIDCGTYRNKTGPSIWKDTYNHAMKIGNDSEQDNLLLVSVNIMYAYTY